MIKSEFTLLLGGKCFSSPSFMNTKLSKNIIEFKRESSKTFLVISISLAVLRSYQENVMMVRNIESSLNIKGLWLTE